MSILSRVLLVALIALAGLAVWQRGTLAQAERARDNAQTAKKVAEQERDNAIAVIAVERHLAETLTTIGAKHEEDRTAAQAVPAAIVADLRAGRLQLRDDLATCSTSLLSQAVAGTVQRDAHAELRAEVAGVAVQIGREADDHVRATQDVVRADRE